MIAEELELVGLGFAVVLIVLTALWGITAAIGRIVVGREEAARAAAARRAEAARAQAPQTVPAAAMAAGSAAPAGVPPHHLAAIAAAVAVLVPGRHRIIDVVMPPHTAPAWINEGRYEHMSSHGGRASAGWTIPGPPHVDHPIHQANPLANGSARTQKRTP
ncbi:OadG family transporter subunit [Caenispirillum bisanense]|uniref:Oxaloacetate decarboxylase, gamma chain n=1 Tax=Caenispirillum bisanense TaxID=414052 RepID=A0A286G9I5_9PROT|nr:OadG family transporter subunit [Caenispirillum bisanense]SOD92171.1 Oxaloacetate decarboxylase, gamma chain [Caenispirillum bisanense]